MPDQRPSHEPAARQQTSLAELLRARRGAILASWEDRARRLPSANPASAPVLLEHVSGLLDRIAESSKRRGGDRRSFEDLWIPGADPERVVAELLALRWTIHETNAREPRPAPLDELLGLDESIDAVAVATLARTRDERDAARATETRLLAMFDHAPASMYVKDADGRLVRVNRSYAALYGRSQEELAGRFEREFTTPEIAEAFARNDRLVLERGEPLEVEEWFPSAGELRAFASVKFRAQGSSGPLVFGISTDVTDRKRMEDWLRFLVESGRILAASLDYEHTLNQIARLATPKLADACVADVFEGAELRLLGYAPDAAKEAALHDFLAAGPPGRESTRPLSVAIRTRTSLVIPRLDDATFDRYEVPEQVRSALRAFGIQSVMVCPLFGRAEVLGALGFGVSHRVYGMSDLAIAEGIARIAADAIENARLFRGAQDAARAREDVLAIVSHDLRSPLTTVRTVTQGLARGVVDEAVARRLDMVQRATQRMERLLDDLVQATAIRSGHLTVRKRRELVSSLLEEALDHWEAPAAQRKIHLRRWAGGEAIEVSCDRDRVGQVLSNLIGNAVKFCRAGDTISVGAEVREREVRILVSDTGPGIDVGDLAHLFDPYWSARRHMGKGTGLGLYISRGLVEAHGGQMGVESATGRGSTFWFTLPRA
jgi:PAS domain S-box-containing protein